MNLRRQLLLVSLLTLSLPWAGCQYLRQVDSALAEGQIQALEATSSAIAARLASAPQLIAPDPERHSRPPGAQLYVHPLPQAPLLDGYGDEWRALSLPPRQLPGTNGEPLAQITLGRRGDNLYLLITVKDLTPSFHDPRSGMLASGDSVELFTASRHYTLPVASQGAARALWHNPRRGDSERELRLRGRWSSSANGYQLELALPYALTGGELAIAVNDRSNSRGGAPRRRANTLPADGRPGKLVQPIPALQQELEHFARPQLQLTVVDSEGFVLADTGERQSPQGFDPIEDSDAPAPTPAADQQPWLRSWIYRKLLTAETLPAMPAGGLPDNLIHNRETARQWFRGPRDSRIGLVSVPVITRADNIVERPLLGRVIVSQSSDALQALTETAAQRLWLITFTAAALALVLLLGYASWLSWRIRRLHRAARNAVDHNGKLRGDFPRSRATDELGALNRAFASLLGELDHYHQYLRSLSGKLSHELRTPLAVMRSSLDNLNACELDRDSRRYATRAMEGGARLSAILNALSAASDLEASIGQAEKEEFDLVDLMDVLTQSYAGAHPLQKFKLEYSASPQRFYGAPELLAQLLDKLIDNACSFAPEKSEIILQLQPLEQEYRISVSNTGPTLPAGFDRKLFDSLVSIRDGGGKAGHLGLGLHIARLIADFHRGQLTAADRPDGSGVIFTLRLPRQQL